MPGSRASTSRLLCEGWTEPGCASGIDGTIFYPEVVFVTQPGKVFFAKGDPKTLGEALAPFLTESAGQGATIVESYEKLDLEERRLSDGRVVKTPKSGRWVVEGPFQRSDVRNANKRVYSRGLWEKLIGDPKSYAQQNVRERGMLGHIEHPSDGRTDGKLGALLVTDLKLKEDGVVWGRAELLDTPHGLILQEYTRAGVRWGVSSRGNGVVKEDGMVDESSYVLETWDAVMKPSVPGAYPALANSAPAAKNESTNTPAPAAGAQSAIEYIGLVHTLTETAIDGLDSSERATLTRDLLRAMTRGSALMSSNELSQPRGIELQGLLTTKAIAVAEAAPRSVDSMIEEALSAAEGEGEDSGDAVDAVLKSLRDRLRDSVQETEATTERLEVAESRANALQQQCDSVVEQLSEVEAQLVATKAKLVLAEDLLATQPGAQANGLVTAAVEEAIRQVPDLARFRDLLIERRTREAVLELAERLLPVAVKRIPRRAPADESTTTAVTLVRTSLPRGQVSSDDASLTAPRRPLVESLPSEVRLVSSVLAKKP